MLEWIVLFWNILFDFQLLLPGKNRESFLQGSVFLNVISHYGMSLFWVFMELDHEFIQGLKLMKKFSIKHCAFMEAHGCCPHHATLHAIDFSWQI